MNLTFFIFLNILISIFFLTGGVFFLFASSDPKTIELIKEKMQFPLTKEILLGVSIIYIVFSILFLISGIGLKMKKKWAHKFTIFLSLFFCLLILIGSLKASFNILNILFFLYLGIQIFYLTKKEVLELFK